MLLLIFIAIFAVRRETELRSAAQGFFKPLGRAGVRRAAAARRAGFRRGVVLFVTGFGVLFIAGARLRYVLLAGGGGVGAHGAAGDAACRTAWRASTSFLDPWADPYNSGFQLTQSLIAIGRGEWFGVGLGESVQKLFYLPEAHTDFLFAVLAEELGLVGVAGRRSRCSSRWCGAASGSRSSRRAPACSSRPTWPRASACGSALQAFINIGVNMGVLPTKGLTLPLMSYGRSSMLVTLAWVGLLLRVYHEAMQLARHGERARDARARRAAGGATMSARTVLIMAGGTGGHVFPALALARLLRARREVVWLGTRARPRGAASCPPRTSPIEWLAMSGLRGKGVADAARRAVQARACRSGRRCGVMRRRKPARRARLRRLRHRPRRRRRLARARAARDPRAERDRRLTNRCSRASRAACSRRFPAAFRPASTRAWSATRCAPRSPRSRRRRARFARRDGRAAPARVRRQPGRRAAQRRRAVRRSRSCRTRCACACCHQTGERGIDDGARGLRAAGVPGRGARRSSTTWRSAYADADLVLCRAGARPSPSSRPRASAAVLVPFPAAVDDHQTRNARVLVREGAARC